jgi:DNA primase
VALFPQTFLDEVRAAADIVTVVSDYVSLRKAGASYKGLCPFHGEKTPSFQVNRERGLFYCFGCSVGGDVFKFVELQEKVGFADAVRLLAQRFGIPVPEIEASASGRENAAEREALLTIHEVASTYFRQELQATSGARIRTYLERDRGLTAETIAALGLGYAPPGRDALRRHLLAQGFSPATLITSGLVVRREDGSEVDRFRSRLMVPIARESGSVIAFGGRALEQAQVPKYLNSPETPIYTKSRTLYGLNLAKAELKSAGFAVVVEGYFDFAQVYQAGVRSAVATCGTALTAQQAHALRRFTGKAVLCFDGDAAGQGAAARSSELLVSEGFDVNVALLPPGHDPDTLLKQQGREAFLARLRDSRPYLDFLLDRASAEHDLGRDDSRRAFLSRMLAVAAKIPDPAVRDQFADRLAHKARVTEEVVRTEIRKAAAARRTDLPAERVPTLSARLRPAERGLIWALVHEPATALPPLVRLENDDVEGLRSSGVLRAARELSEHPPDDVPSALLERLSTEEAQLVAAVAAEASPPVLRPDDCADALRYIRLERQRAELQLSIDRAQAHGGADAGELTDLLQRKLDLQRRLDQAHRRGVE